MTGWMSSLVGKGEFPRHIPVTCMSLFALALLPVVGSAAEPPDCSGYPEERVFLEAQAWWWLSDKTDREQTGDDFGHVHVGTCFPHGQTVSGDVVFDVRLVMHNNPGYIHHLVISVWDDEPDNCWGSGTACVDLRDNPLTCPDGETCVWWFNVVVPTDTLSTDGRKEFRFRPFMEQPDGNRLFPSTGWQAYVDNGRPANDYMPSDTVPDLVDLVTIDVSFISLKVIVPQTIKFMKNTGSIVALVKPQFEVGKGHVGKGGVVRDEKLHESVLNNLTRFFSQMSLQVVSTIMSPITGPKGNKEFVLFLKRKTVYRNKNKP